MERPLDKRKRHTFTMKVNDFDKHLIDKMADLLDITKGETVRRCVWMMRILSDLPLGKVLKKKDYDEDKTLLENMRSFPELAKEAQLELKFWTKMAREEE